MSLLRRSMMKRSHRCSLRGSWTEVQCRSLETRLDVRFGSQADMCVAKRNVRFTPNSDRKSRHPQKVMSALPPKADMCGALADVCYGPIADMAVLFDRRP